MSSGHGVDYATGTQMTKDALCNAAKVKEEAFEEQMLALELDLAMADVENILRMEHYTSLSGAIRQGTGLTQCCQWLCSH
ncbi:hypothetical protein TREES_T100009772 [Tupaia chinensis]|uniref:Uncharacterized protein n=1 Tax=Tupaia chinensis TaxID=246437 RepID=L9KRU2_TUPCH|nr:hypothetical protein TREES_T100009772 [Tupaia chinensis]